MIGKGSFGEVYQFNYFAIKRIKIVSKKKNNMIDEIMTILNEVNILSSLNHPNILELIDVQFNINYIDLITNLFDYNLDYLIKNYIIYFDQRKKILYQIFCGLNYLHSNKIIHRDLKPSNIFVKSNLNLVIGDFGLSKFLSNCDCLQNNYINSKNKYYQNFLDQFKDILSNQDINLNNDSSELSTYVVTRWYRAPELLCNQDFYNSKIDIWCCGCIWGELIRGTPLFRGKNNQDQLNIIINSFGIDNLSSPDIYIQSYLDQCKRDDKDNFINFNLLEIYSCILQDEIDLLNRCLKVDFSKRSSAQEILESSFFK